MSAAEPRVEGHVSPGFEAVREAFAANFVARRELGGACCIYHHGEKVVDLWGGIRNKETGEPWEQDTMVIVYSTTKGLAAMTLAARALARLARLRRTSLRVLAGVRAARARSAITVRQLLAHQAGLFALDEPVDRGVVADLDRARRGARSPEARVGHRERGRLITQSPLAIYESELLRRVDPRHRSLGRFFQDEIASPLGLDVYIRLPDDDSQLAPRHDCQSRQA